MKAHMAGLLAALLMGTPSVGAPAPTMSAYWHRVALAARDVCGEVSDAGSDSSASVKLGGQLTLSKVLQTLGKVGIDGRLRAGEHWWHGQLQSDLPRLHEANQACMEHEFDRMTSSLILRDRRTHSIIRKPRPAQAHAAIVEAKASPPSLLVSQNEGIVTYGQTGGQNTIINARAPRNPNGLYIGDLQVGSMYGFTDPDNGAGFTVRKMSLFDGQDPEAVFIFRDRMVKCDILSTHSSSSITDARGSALTIWDVRCEYVR